MTRVLVVAMVRDLFDGEAMAKVMSLVFMTFMLVPVLAPNIGQAILLFAPWRAESPLERTAARRDRRPTARLAPSPRHRSGA